MNEIIYGIHVIEEFIKNKSNKILCILFLKSRKDIKFKKLILISNEKNIKIKFVDKKFLNKITNNKKHQGIVAYIKNSKILKEPFLLKMLENKKNYFFLILDGIMDPRNLGSCIRSAYIFGVQAVIIRKNRSAKISSAVKKVASGSLDLIPLIYVTNLVRTINLLKKYNIQIIGTSRKAQLDICNKKLKQSIAVVMGSENLGISRLVKENCDNILNIPTVKNNLPLNISVATGICIFEIIRKNYLNKFNVS
ncbi:yjfH [Wigglesworthia glossinidia endosymbiont of Glossina brevipalpis]|uniref:YjfH protein n=1 Tax=Wigglesworthia glossinidia brevipalpis TaxID=36870 RepID=Q8D323_WIGBR|nr:yjfH [Wigglesworthia glossinidia endosymbiont of Glossina brevipalpis]